jgi:GMP synthase (glutamine-hydrolysing)
VAVRFPPVGMTCAVTFCNASSGCGREPEPGGQPGRAHSPRYNGGAGGTVMTLVFFQNCEAEGIGSYEEDLRTGGVSLSIVHAYRGEALPPLESVEAVIVGGSPVCACRYEEHDFLVKEWAFLEAAQQRGAPILGLCFGAQLLAMVNGAEVTRNPVMEIGVYGVTLTDAGRADPMFAGFPRSFPVFQWHGDTFGVPPSGSLLAQGRDCRHQAFRCGRSRGLQFHLEVSAAEAGRWADAYRDELARFGKTRDELDRECVAWEGEMSGLASLLMRNFVDMVGAGRG